jgi:hypothetical protein
MTERRANEMLGNSSPEPPSRRANRARLYCLLPLRRRARLDIEVLAILAAALVAFVTTALTLLVQARSRREEHEKRQQDRIHHVISRYREPLSSAAFDLQSRLINIVEFGFLEKYYVGRTDGDRYRFYAENNTLWLVGQYLAWVTIIRREVRFLDLGSVEESRDLENLINDVRKAFASDSRITDPAFRIFRGDQRAIGELMTITRATGQETYSDSMGYAAFVASLKAGSDLEFWLHHLRDEIDVMAKDPTRRQRLNHIQSALVDLVLFLDAENERFPRRNLTKLPT